jgi:hypothetical protein
MNEIWKLVRIVYINTLIDFLDIIRHSSNVSEIELFLYHKVKVNSLGPNQ